MKRLLIIRCGLLGDTIDSTSIITPLIEHFGEDVEIDWIVKDNVQDLFKFDHRINPITVKYSNLPLFLNFDKLKIIVKSYIKPYQAIINLELGKKFNSIVRLSNSDIKVGMPYSFIPLVPGRDHRVHHQFNIVRSYFHDLNTNNAYPEIISSNIDVSKTYNIHNEYIVLCPTNSHFKKMNYRGYRAWPLKNWQELIRKILEDTDLDIVITGTKSEMKFIDMLNINNPRIHNLCGKTDIPNLAQVMKKSVCVVANDSGAAHVAGASCRKVIALHGPTPFHETGPYGNGNNKIIEASINMECSPCFKTDKLKKCPSNDCMINLSPEIVFNYVIR